MRKYALYILFALLATSCVRQPDGILSRNQMVDVLVDLHRTDGIVFVKGFQYSHEGEQTALYALTLKKHGITQAEFDSSIVWYTDHPVYFNIIYPKVVSRLESEQAALVEQINSQQELLKNGHFITLRPLEEVLADWHTSELGHWAPPAPAPTIYIYGVLTEQQEKVHSEMLARKRAEEDEKASQEEGKNQQKAGE